MAEQPAAPPQPSPRGGSCGVAWDSSSPLGEVRRGHFLVNNDLRGRGKDAPPQPSPKREGAVTSVIQFLPLGGG